MVLPITFVDVIVLLVLLVSAAFAAWRGFMSETLSIFSWAAAAFSTLYFGPWMVPMMRGVISSHWLAAAAAYAGIFFVVLVPLSFISYRFADAVKHSPIGPLDRGLGIAFGVVRGLVIVGLAYMAFTYFVPIRDQPTALTKARTLPVVQSSAEVLLSLAPSRDYTDFATQPPPSPDQLGNLIRRNNVVNGKVEDHVPHKDISAAGTQKGYGAKDRRALDNLLQATENGGSGKP